MLKHAKSATKGQPMPHAAKHRGLHKAAKGSTVPGGHADKHNKNYN